MFGKKLTGQMIQNMFVEQLRQIQKNIGQPKNTVEEGGNSMEDLEEERPADKTPNYDEETGRGAMHMITILHQYGNRW